MEQEDFWLLRKGWSDKLIYEQTIARRMTYIIHCSLVPKPARIYELWPLPGDNEIVMSDKVKNLLQKQKQGTLLIPAKRNGR